MKACIILHNMIVEDEWDDNEVADLNYEQIDGVDNPPIQVSREQSDGFMAYIQSLDALEIEKFILNSNWISLNIYSNCKASHMNFLFIYLFIFICWEAWVIGTCANVLVLL